ncbi:MAG: hypothetical protein Q4E12_00340 [Coriobacteriia bacterium]|nr:hypothetical protein [Coriobacteriia bacterium]
MAKQKARAKRASAKHVHAAALIKRQQQQQLVKLILCVIGGVALWAVYTFVIHDLMPNGTWDSLGVFAICFVLVVFIGLVGNKYASLSSEYRKAKNEWGVTDEEVKAHMAKM